MKGFVYKWTNNINGKWYIGSHNGRNKYYKAGGIGINRAFRKYGIESFTRDILYTGEHYAELEEFILEELDAKNDKNSYNMSNNHHGGGSQRKGKDHHYYGKKRPKWHCDSISKGKTGRQLSEEHKKKVSDGRKGIRGYSIPCIVDGVEFDSTIDAANYFNVTRHTIANWKKTGRAITNKNNR